MKLANPVFSFALMSVMIVSALPAQAVVSSEPTAASEKTVMERAKSLIGMTIPQTITFMNSLSDQERSEILLSLQEIAESTKSDIASLKAQIVAEQARHSFEETSPDGHAQREVRLQVPYTLAKIAAGGYAAYGLSLIPYYKIKNPTGLKRVFVVSTGVIGCLGLLSGIAFTAAAAQSGDEVRYPASGLDALKAELIKFETKVDGEAAVLQILSARYGIQN